MNTNDYLSTQPRQSCVASFQIIYGIGKVKASRLNSFLLNHPIQSRFLVHFKEIMYPSHNFDIWQKIPRSDKIRLWVESHLRKKSLIFSYQAYRLFQNLPTKGQRTKANANSILNHHPYKSLLVNMSVYQQLEVAFKKRELLYNERYDELKAYTISQTQKEKASKEDLKQKKAKSKQDFIKNKKINKK